MLAVSRPRLPPPRRTSSSPTRSAGRGLAAAGSRTPAPAGNPGVAPAAAARWDLPRASRDGQGQAQLLPAAPSPAKEGWRRVLKAAIKKFKARQRRSRQAPLLQMMLPML
ncbi:hypothetical protein SEVIR_6G024550v4 [Setaria viridis]